MARTKQTGFTLVEVLIFITIISMMFIMSLSLATSSLRAIKTNENRTYASYHAEALREWVTSEREADWNTFLTHAPEGATTYCFNTVLDASSVWPEPGECSANELDGVYARNVTLTRQASQIPGSVQVLVEVTSAWMEGQNSYDVEAQTILSSLN